MIDIITRMDKHTRLFWTGSALLVLIFTTFIFFNDVYSTYWGLNDLSVTYGVVVGLPPDSPYAGVVNYLISLGFGISALFLMAMAGLVSVQIEINRSEGKEVDKLVNLRGKVLSLAIFLAIIDFCTDVSFRFSEGEGFSKMWQTPVYAEAIVVGIVCGVVLGFLVSYLLRYDAITSFVSGVVLGYISFIVAGAMWGADVAIFISFAISSISTIMVYTFANEVLFAVSASYLMVALPLVMKDYDLSFGKVLKRESSESTQSKEVKRSGLDNLADTITGFSAFDADDERTSRGGNSNSRGNRGNR